MHDSRGFTLIEMMLTIGIAAIVLTLGSSAFASLRSQNMGEAAAENITSALHLARMQAMTSGTPRSVSFDFQNNRYTDAAGTVRELNGATITAYSCNNPNCSVGSATSGTITFLPEGGATTAGDIMVSSPGNGTQHFITVNSITSNIRHAASCVAGVCR
ncbi:MAG: prepilin-type N-terminal cleavage/methylation domain-containing protein [Alphaproteobacteria bacterium]|nr:MAG: prepilin-type N-terminal cleavage/methylation domain-containing protein [Alphaproteobacteria bacterium]